MPLSAAQAADFATYARRPETWAVAARRQLAVAKHLFEHQRTLAREAGSSFEERSGSYYAGYLHAGLAIENAAKACLGSIDPSVVTAQGTIDRSKFGSNAGHGLPQLAERALGSLSQENLSLLQKLQEYVVWAGKYTVPMSAEVLYDEQRMNRLRTGHWLEPQRVESLVDRLLLLVRATP